MIDRSPGIFRADAVRRYAQRREQTVLPPSASAPVLVCLWLLMGLLVAGTLATWFAQVPVYVSGPAVLVDWRGTGRHPHHRLVVLAFLPVTTHTRPHPGQQLSVTLSPAGTPLQRPVLAVEPGVFSPAAAQRRFALPAGAAQAITGPSVVVLALLGAAPGDLPMQAYVGGVYRADLAVGWQRVLSPLPLIGPLAGQTQ